MLPGKKAKQKSKTWAQKTNNKKYSEPLLFSPEIVKLTTVISLQNRRACPKSFARFCSIPVEAETGSCHWTCTRRTTNLWLCSQMPNLLSPRNQKWKNLKQIHLYSVPFFRPDAWKQAGRQNPGCAFARVASTHRPQTLETDPWRGIARRTCHPGPSQNAQGCRQANQFS